MPDSVTEATLVIALAAALLVVVSGVAKVRSPGPTLRMITALRLPGWTRVPHPVRIAAVRTLGVAEIVAGVGFAAFGGRWSALALTVLYAGFTGTVLTSLRRGGGVACGCFGAGDAAPGRPHLAVDVVAALAAFVAVLRPTTALAGIGGHDAVVAVVLGLQVALVASLGYLCLTALPELASIRRRLAEEV